MDLRKIIKEEINDFEWAKDTPAGDVYVGATYINSDDGDVIDVIGIDDTRAFVTYNGRNGQTKKVKSIEGWLSTGVWVRQGLNESEDFDWMKELTTSNTENLIDLMDKTLDRLPILYRDREDEFSYGWINQVRSSLQFIKDDKTDKTMVGPTFLYELIIMVIRSLDTIKMTVSGTKEYPDDVYEDAREKIEEVKDHLDVNLNTNSINL